jgi:hypothetical protein
MMVTNYFSRKRSLLETVLVFLISARAYNAATQVLPGLRQPLSISTYSTFTDAQPSFRYYYDLAAGISPGDFLQTRHVGSVDVRGSLLK